MPAARPTLAHVPALDGLRGLAVAAVVAYHAGAAGVTGGFLGVSAFFTLSGFLITSLLLVEWAGTGRVSLSGFWSRRFRRLLPAAVAVIGAVAVASTWLADGGQLADLRGDVLAGLGYVANWRFVLEERSYAELFTGPSPLHHLWSLAIEEQFYVVFPLLAAGILGLGRGRRWVLGSVLGALAAASLAWSVHLSASPAGTSRAYYDTGARAAELLAGCLLAVVVAGRTDRLGRHARVLAPAGTLALAGIGVAWSLAPQDASWLPGGGFAVHAAAVVVVLLAAHVPGPVRTLCSTPVLRLLGRVSYGVYLIHWPVFVWLDAERVGVGGPALTAVRLAVTAGLTAASYHLVEQPIRRHRDPIRLRGLVGALASVVLVAGVAAAVADTAPPADDVLVALDDLRAADPLPPARPIRPASASAPAPAPSTTEAGRAAEAGSAADAGPEAPAGTTTSPRVPVDRVLLVGDSVMSQGYEQQRQHFAELGIATTYAGGPGTGPLSPQGSWLSQVEAWVAADDPDVVVVEACCNYTIEPPERYVDAGGDAVAPGSDAVLPAWEREIRAVLDAADDRGARVVLVRMAPVQTNGFYGDIEAHVDAVNDLYDRLARELDVELLDWGEVLAPGGEFAWEVPGPDGSPVRVRIDDGVHLTEAGSDLVAEATAAHVRRR